MPCLRASAVVIHYEEALYQKNVLLTFLHLRESEVGKGQRNVAKVFCDPTRYAHTV